MEMEGAFIEAWTGIELLLVPESITLPAVIAQRYERVACLTVSVRLSFLM